ncbi:M48 family metallopeptidase [Myroides sp. 1354]|uniref:M48 family metallopeptidase n=1 Tax=unclassified Myroides TaxID=2642485 RepID=UPI00257738FE|nr:MULTISPECIES: M48 family metallopeptidase [unclassified Myroides]MDM1043612.1 M48 family metallopeptidase [Myroides sp. R163-1]MDM1054338.1 M48 family metallopeptidase [Myroides sp. 1354]MDM1067634.1 M48 family metallopeptidase [Myroides sp. 1372]
MKKFVFTAAVVCLGITTAQAQLGKLSGKKIDALTTVASAFTVSDAEIKQSAQEAVKWMDENNQVCSLDSKQKDMREYAERLERIFGPYKNYDGLNLNYKVYYVTDINAFACADGSIRVFSSLMDIMSDDELLAIIGHEIGHVKLEHTLNAYKQILIAEGAVKFVGSTKGTAADLMNSNLGGMAEKFMSASFSRKQETDSDDYSYKFLVANGKNPQALADGFQKFADMEKEYGADKSLGAKMSSSHPDSEKRVKRVEDKIKKGDKK